MTFFGKEMEGIYFEGCKAMTWEDAEEMGRLNAENGWSFSTEDLNELLFSHMLAYIFVLKGDDTANNGTREMEMIEYRLEDANYHTFANLLHRHEYEDAKAWMYEEG